MGTFHQGMGELHGITVVVDTTGEEIFVGRCHDVTPRGVILHDVDVHRDGEGGRSKEDYVRRAAQFGVWKKYDHLIVPNDEVASIRRLGEV
jgi:hypothetical protein